MFPIEQRNHQTSLKDFLVASSYLLTLSLIWPMRRLKSLLKFKKLCRPHDIPTETVIHGFSCRYRNPKLYLTGKKWRPEPNKLTTLKFPHHPLVPYFYTSGNWVLTPAWSQKLMVHGLRNQRKLSNNWMGSFFDPST